MDLIGAPFSLFKILNDHKCPHAVLFAIRLVLLTTFGNISIFSLLFISFKRYRILHVNSATKDSISSKTACKEIGLIWIIGIIVGIAPFISTKRNIFEFYIIFRFVFLVVLPVVILGIFNFKIYKIILNKINNHRQITNINPGKIAQKKNEELLKREKGVTLNICLIVVIFMITWIPVQIQFILGAFVTKAALNENIFAVSVIILHVNSVVHPFLYAFRVYDIRSAVCNILGLKRST
ncbi:hypothetical protein ACKWTF_003856 [Chironomus riparius]